MIHYSVIIPQRDRADDVRRQLPALSEALDQLGQPYEIIVVDDASAAPNVRLLDKLLGECHALTAGAYRRAERDQPFDRGRHPRCARRSSLGHRGRRSLSAATNSAAV